MATLPTQDLLDQGIQVRPRPQRGEISTSGGLGDTLQHRFIEPSGHHGTAFVSDKTASRPRSIELRDRDPVERPDTDRVDLYALVEGSLQRPFDLTLVVLPVRDHDEHAMVPCTLLERIQGHRERLTQVGPLDGDQIWIHGVQEERRRTVIHSERALNKCISGESDEADTISIQALEDTHDFQACPLQPVRCHVLGQHRARHVERYHHVLSLTPYRLDARPELRTSKGQDQKGDRHEHEYALGRPPPSAEGRTQFLH